MFFFYDPAYLLFVMLPSMLIAGWASFNVRGTFAKYARVRARSGMTGAEAARTLLLRNGIDDVQVVPSQGLLTDLYDPMRKVIRLSSEVYGSDSLSAIGVACHEAGHAVQHHQGYFPLHLRNTMVPALSFASGLSWILIVAGFMLHTLGIAQIGVLLFSLTLIYQVVTLPVEFNASHRALALMTREGIVTSAEQDSARRVLRAAALTYVAAVVTALLNLLWLMLQTGMIGGRRRD